MIRMAKKYGFGTPKQNRENIAAGIEELRPHVTNPRTIEEVMEAAILLQLSEFENLEEDQFIRIQGWLEGLAWALNVSNTDVGTLDSMLRLIKRQNGLTVAPVNE